MKRLINKLVNQNLTQNLGSITNIKSNHTTERERSAETKNNDYERYSNPVQFELENSIENEGKQSNQEFKKSHFKRGEVVQDFKDTREVIYNRLKESKNGLLSKSQYRSNSNYK
jgi:hypothetical protein